MNPRTPIGSASPATQQRLDIARCVANAHAALRDPSMAALVSGSTVEDLCDERSDVDMSVLFDVLPDEARLRGACQRVGSDWFWSQGALADGSLVVAFRVDGIETQIAYSSWAALQAEADDLLVAHNPDTPTHKLAEGVLKAQALAGAPRIAALQARFAAFPPALGQAMVRHGLLAAPTPWRAMAQIVHRDADLWCRDIEVDACYRLLLALAGLNDRYFTRFQFKRMRRFAATLSVAPAALAERIEALLAAPPPAAFAALYQLEGEVLALAEARWLELDFTPLRSRREAFGASAA